MGKRVKVSARKKEYKPQSVAEALLEELYTILLTLYLLVIFMVMPLYIYDHYYEMAFFKWKIYLFATFALLGIVLGTGVFYGTVAIHRNNKEKERNPDRYFYFRNIWQFLSVTDLLAVFYGISVVITLSTCGHPRAAWLGTDSWYMGALAQLLFVGTFLVFSWLKAPVKDVIWMSLIASGICFVIGIAQRYGWDFFHLYYGMPDEVIRDYLSTIGNRTWYSGYISVVFPIGVYLFWRREKKIVTCLAGVYTFLAFSAIVTNYSDSIYVAFAAVLYALFVMSVGSLKKIYHWMCTLVIWFASCSAMSVLEIYFQDDIHEVRGMSRLFLDIRVAVLGLVLTGVMAFVLWYLMKKRNGKGKEKWKRECALKTRIRMQIGCIAAVFAAAGLLIGIIIMNTRGILQEWFGFTIENNYLIFDNWWGDCRGFNWKMTMCMFSELPLFQKFFGIGSDCYAFYAYSNPMYAEELISFFGQNTMVANSHNEWLNSLLCNGIVGCSLYLGLFICVIVKCFRQCDSEHIHPIVPAVGLCVLGYMTHNMFCYQQSCATGPVFILMGLAMQTMRIGGKRKNEF